MAPLSKYTRYGCNIFSQKSHRSWSFLVLMLLATKLLPTMQMGYIIKRQVRKEVEHGVDNHQMIKEIVGVNAASQCLENCLQECLSSAFQMCDDGRCQCWKVPENENAPNLQLIESQTCDYYSFKRKTTETRGEQCMYGRGGCLKMVNCCNTSNPCHHGGQCLPVVDPASKKRFRCVCDKDGGYGGPTCSYRAQSCHDYDSGAIPGAPPVRGFYRAFYKPDKSYRVYCDFDNKGAWTLIQSYSLKESDQVVRYTKDKDLNKDAPDRVEKYRLPAERIQKIEAGNPRWRITCDQPTPTGSSYVKDYVIGRREDVDLLSFTGSGCSRVEEMKIGDAVCHECTVGTEQGSDNEEMFHIAMSPQCDFDFGEMTSSGADGDLKFFGPTDDEPYSMHHCTIGEASLTQTWLGTIREQLR